MSAAQFVHTVVLRNSWVTPEAITALGQQCGLWFSGSSCTARIREMRKLGYIVETRPASHRMPGSKCVEYSARKLD